ncbi:hypothetical protein [Cellulomonas sp. KRMCY2]|uniref:hypothetical protein n=1 Tax=Cellulomonas sp. KRMCY2 TaxID=1304865 RepID=UPI00045EA947|nr:hypothetical protein [Cellulomonas sp. KRMCY2]
MTEWLAVLAGTGALALSALAGAPLTAAVLRLAARSADAGGDDPGHGAGTDPDHSGDGPVGDRARGTLRGGLWIGILERLAITGALLTGYPAGIAFVIAVKGLGRYPELRENPGASERFVIGTLTSMLWAVLVGGAFRLLVL